MNQATLDPTLLKPSGTRPAFLAFAGDEPARETLRAYAESKHFPKDSVHAGDIESATAYLKTHPSPHILVVDIADAQTAAKAFDALADHCEPGTLVIAIGAINEYSFYRWLVGIGVGEYLLKPLTVDMLEGAVSRLRAPKSPQVQTTEPAAKMASQVIAVIGTRGGVGATMLSVNLASVISADHKQPVTLVDLDPQHGTVSMLLDLEPGRGLRDALEKPDRIDSLFLERVTMRYDERLSVLSAEEALDDQVHYHEKAVPSLLLELRKKPGIILLDLSRSLNALTRQSLKAADQVVLVTEMTLPGLRDALRLQDFMRDVIKTKPPLLVANRVGLAPKHEIARVEFEKGIGATLGVTVPFDVDIFAAGASGELLIEKHKHAASLKQVRALAARLLPDSAVAMLPSAATGRKNLSFFKKHK